MKLNALFVPILFLSALLLLLIVRVNNIDCFVENNPCPDDLTKKTTVLKGSSFFFGDFEKKLKANQPENTIYILQKVTKKFPGTLILNFKQEQIEYVLLHNEKIKYIGLSGTTIPENSKNQQSLIIDWKNDSTIIENDTVIEKYHPVLLEIAQTLAGTAITNPRIFWNSDAEIILEVPDNPIFIFDLQTIETQIKKVDTIINARELDEVEESILEIDMRFDLPVLRTRQ